MRWSSMALSTILMLGCARAIALPPPSGPLPVPPAAQDALPAAPVTPAPAGAIDLQQARAYLADFDAMCSGDAGKLWGVTLCGPLLFADPATRQVVTNQADTGGVLVPRSGVFVGRLPDSEAIANTATAWSGVRWTMMMWGALDGERAPRLALMAHEAFHRVQPDLGLWVMADLNAANAQLDTEAGRVWLQLEWDALQKALLATGPARTEAVADALTFRAARRAKFPKAASRENALEVNEGLAEYTGQRLAGYSEADTVKAAAKRRASNTGFVRSFAYVSGPLYGFVLDGFDPGWRKGLTRGVDLGAWLAARAKVAAHPVRDAEAASDKYDGKALRAAEKDRAHRRAEQIATWRKALIDGPVLIVDLTDAGGTFDPRRVFPLGEGGDGPGAKQVVYTTRKLTAPWGTLEVDEGGAILEDGATHEAHVSLAGISADGLRGKDWTLTLSEGWTRVPGARQGDVTLRKR